MRYEAHLDSVVKDLGHLFEIQFVLDEDAFGREQQRERVEDIEAIRDFHGRHGFRQVNEDHVE